MDCYRHPGVMFQTMCGGCGRPMCKECMQRFIGRNVAMRVQPAR